MKNLNVITRAAELEPLLQAIAMSDEIAIDTEADSLFAYKAKVCLIQIGTPGADWIVDPLDGIDLQPLLDALAHKDLLLHGSDYDLRMLSSEYGFKAQRVWDTMIAARYLNEKHFGLAALVHKFYGVELDKSNQKANWAKRPMPQDMLEYASEDTHYLAGIVKIQREALAQQGKLHWVEEHCARLLIESTLPQNLEYTPSPDAWRIKGSHHLERREMALLKNLWAFREKWAAHRNIPSFKIMTNDKLLEYAQRYSGFKHLQAAQLHSLPRNIHGTLFDEMLDALNQGLSLSYEDCPEPLPRPVPPPAPNVQLMEKFKDIRDRLAEQWDIDPSLICNRHQMTHLGLNFKTEGLKALAGSQMLQWQQELWKVELQKL